MSSRRFGYSYILVLLVAIGLAGLLVRERRELAERALIAQLASLGVAESRLVVAELGPFGFELRDLRLGPDDDEPDLSIASLSATYSASSLISGELDRIVIDGVRLRGREGPDGFSMGVLDAIIKGTNRVEEPEGSRDSDALLSTPASIPIAHLEIANARMEYEAEWGEVELTLEMRADSAEGAAHDFEFDLRAVHPWGSGHALAAGRLEPSTLEMTLSVNSSVDFNSSDVSVAGTSLKLETAIRIDRDGLVLSFPECIELVVNSLQVPNVLDVSQPMNLCIQGGSEAAVSIGLDDSSLPRIQADLRLDSFPIAGMIGAGDEALRFEAQLPATRLRIEDALVSVETDGGHFFVPLYEFDLQGIGLRVEYDVENGLRAAHLDLENIANRVQVDHYPILKLRGEFTPADSGGHAFDVVILDASEILALRITGLHELDDATSSAKVRMTPLRFDLEGTQPAALYPALDGVVSEVEGGLGFEGDVEWHGADLSGRFNVTVDNLSFTTDWGRAFGIAGQIELKGPFPFYMEKTQRLTVDRLLAGFEWTEGVIDFRQRSDGKLELEKMEWSLAGGRVGASGLFDPFGTEHDLELEVEKIDPSFSDQRNEGRDRARVEAAPPQVVHLDTEAFEEIASAVATAQRHGRDLEPLLVELRNPPAAEASYAVEMRLADGELVEYVQNVDGTHPNPAIREKPNPAVPH